MLITMFTEPSLIKKEKECFQSKWFIDKWHDCGLLFIRNNESFENLASIGENNSLIVNAIKMGRYFKPKGDRTSDVEISNDWTELNRTDGDELIMRRKARMVNGCMTDEDIDSILEVSAEYSCKAIIVDRYALGSEICPNIIDYLLPKMDYLRIIAHCYNGEREFEERDWMNDERIVIDRFDNQRYRRLTHKRLLFLIRTVDGRRLITIYKLENSIGYLEGIDYVNPKTNQINFNKFIEYVNDIKKSPLQEWGKCCSIVG